MGYLLVSGASNGLALVRHDDNGEYYRYDLGRTDKVISYQRATQSGPRAEKWAYSWPLTRYHRRFATVHGMWTWWRYDRTGGAPFRPSA